VDSAGAFEDRDATRRTRLANERTFLAWWRSGLTALGVGIAVGRVIPELGHQTRWPYTIVGAIYAVFGLGMMIYGTLRQREVEEGIERGVFVAAEGRFLTTFTVLGVGIGLGTLALIVANP
jgi:putative membrane protein